MADQADLSDFETIRDGIEGAVSTAIQSKNGLLIKFIVIADYLDEDGDRMLVEAHTAGLSKWDMLGMVEFAKCDMYGVQASNNVLADSDEED